MKSKDGDTIYVVETPRDIYWSKSKMDAQYRHCDFMWRDKARYKEMSEFKFGVYTSKTPKTIWEIV